MSNSIGRVAGSAAIAVVEATFALNNMNFDFSLVKVEAPLELQPLGSLLSKRRRASAESGPFHILARRLEALFAGALPKVPTLLKQYGKRASEIAETVESTAGSSAGARTGPFSSHTGVDGTTIWASATGGDSALCMHLVACVLARIWSPQEATLTWMDMVTLRQSEVKKAAEDDGVATNAMAYAAALHEFDRTC